ncbi:hypothetical protein AOC36_09235 [Erysipelothrix larvae]|uniref:Signal peptidase I n=1 Tax=Erysipelothrix larvae TaxID=1514105 RepID=A0A0X8H149_9FIRM|nr:signal peptidase I [Erysipelothrix larvae]AMC94165.1 hypothetical protein AOC36_09235 [Erysipelothrix larvae]
MKKNLFNNLLIGLSIVLLLLALHFSLTRKDRDEVFIFGYKPFIITTGSMAPDYPINTLVIIKKTDASSLNVGDPIAFHSNVVNATVFHRVVDITEEGFITKGDNNNDIDPEIIASHDVLGRAVFHTTLAVFLIEIVKTPVNFVLFGLLPIASIMLGLYLFKQYRKHNKEKVS